MRTTTGTGSLGVLEDDLQLTPEQRQEVQRSRDLSMAFMALTANGYLVVAPHDTRRLARYKVADDLQMERYAWLTKDRMEQLIPQASGNTTG